MRTARTLLLPAGDVLTHWCVKPGEVYGAGSSGALDCCRRARGSVSGQRALRSAPDRRRGGVVQVEVLFDRVAGLDVGKASLTVCVRTPGPRGRRSGGPPVSTLTPPPPGGGGGGGECGGGI